MAKKTQKRKLVRLVSAAGSVYYTKYRIDDEKLKGIRLKLRKFDPKTRQHEDFEEAKNKNLGRNEVKKRK